MMMPRAMHQYQYVSPPRQSGIGQIMTVATSTTASYVELDVLFNPSYSTVSAQTKVSKGVTDNYISIFADTADLGVIFGTTAASVTDGNAPILSANGSLSAGIYTPVAAGAGTVTGSTDVTAGSLYGVSATLDGKTVIITANGTGPTTLTLNGATTSASEAALLAALASTWPALIFTVVATNLVITNSRTGTAQTFIIGAGTANTALGLTAATTAGTNGGSCYRIEAGKSERFLVQPTEDLFMGFIGSTTGQLRMFQSSPPNP
jgi:hypothetical protein